MSFVDADPLIDFAGGMSFLPKDQADSMFDNSGSMVDSLLPDYPAPLGNYSGNDYTQLPGPDFTPLGQYQNPDIYSPAQDWAPPPDNNFWFGQNQQPAAAPEESFGPPTPRPDLIWGAAPQSQMAEPAPPQDPFQQWLRQSGLFNPAAADYPVGSPEQRAYHPITDPELALSETGLTTSNYRSPTLPTIYDNLPDEKKQVAEQWYKSISQDPENWLHTEPNEQGDRYFLFDPTTGMPVADTAAGMKNAGLDYVPPGGYMQLPEWLSPAHDIATALDFAGGALEATNIPAVKQFGQVLQNPAVQETVGGLGSVLIGTVLAAGTTALTADPFIGMEAFFAEQGLDIAPYWDAMDDKQKLMAVQQIALNTALALGPNPMEGVVFKGAERAGMSGFGAEAVAGAASNATLMGALTAGNQLVSEGELDWNEVAKQAAIFGLLDTTIRTVKEYAPLRQIPRYTGETALASKPVVDEFGYPVEGPGELQSVPVAEGTIRTNRATERKFLEALQGNRPAPRPALEAPLEDVTPEEGTTHENPPAMPVLITELGHEIQSQRPGPAIDAVLNEIRTNESSIGPMLLAVNIANHLPEAPLPVVDSANWLAQQPTKRLADLWEAYQSTNTPAGEAFRQVVANEINNRGLGPVGEQGAASQEQPITVYHGTNGPLEGPLAADAFVTPDRKVAQTFANAAARMSGGEPTVLAFQTPQSNLRAPDENNFAAAYGGAQQVVNPSLVRPVAERQYAKTDAAQMRPVPEQTLSIGATRGGTQIAIAGEDPSGPVRILINGQQTGTADSLAEAKAALQTAMVNSGVSKTLNLTDTPANTVAVGFTPTGTVGVIRSYQTKKGPGFSLTINGRLQPDRFRTEAEATQAWNKRAGSAPSTFPQEKPIPSTGEVKLRKQDDLHYTATTPDGRLIRIDNVRPRGGRSPDAPSRWKIRITNPEGQRGVTGENAVTVTDTDLAGNPLITIGQAKELLNELFAQGPRQQKPESDYAKVKDLQVGDYWSHNGTLVEIIEPYNPATGTVRVRSPYGDSYDAKPRELKDISRPEPRVNRVPTRAQNADRVAQALGPEASGPPVIDIPNTRYTMKDGTNDAGELSVVNLEALEKGDEEGAYRAANQLAAWQGLPPLLDTISEFVGTVADRLGITSQPQLDGITLGDDHYAYNLLSTIDVNPYLEAVRAISAAQEAIAFNLDTDLRTELTNGMWNTLVHEVTHEQQNGHGPEFWDKLDYNLAATGDLYDEFRTKLSQALDDNLLHELITTETRTYQEAVNANGPRTRTNRRFTGDKSKRLEPGGDEGAPESALPERAGAGSEGGVRAGSEDAGAGGQPAREGEPPVPDVRRTDEQLLRKLSNAELGRLADENDGGALAEINRRAEARRAATPEPTPEPAPTVQAEEPPPAPAPNAELVDLGLPDSAVIDTKYWEEASGLADETNSGWQQRLLDFLKGEQGAVNVGFAAAPVTGLQALFRHIDDGIKTRFWEAMLGAGITGALVHGSMEEKGIAALVGALGGFTTADYLRKGPTYKLSRKLRGRGNFADIDATPGQAKPPLQGPVRPGNAADLPIIRDQLRFQTEQESLNAKANEIRRDIFSERNAITGLRDWVNHKLYPMGIVPETLRDAHTRITGRWEQWTEEALRPIKEHIEKETKDWTRDEQVMTYLAAENPDLYLAALSPEQQRVAVSLRAIWDQMAITAIQARLIDQEVLERYPNYIMRAWDHVTPEELLQAGIHNPASGSAPKMGEAGFEQARSLGSAAEGVLGHGLAFDEHFTIQKAMSQWVNLAGRRAAAEELKQFVEVTRPDYFITKDEWDKLPPSEQRNYRPHEASLFTRPRVDPETQDGLQAARKLVGEIDTQIRRAERWAGYHGTKAAALEAAIDGNDTRYAQLVRQMADQNAQLPARIQAAKDALNLRNDELRQSLQYLRDQARATGRQQMRSGEATARLSQLEKQTEGLLAQADRIASDMDNAVAAEQALQGIGMVGSTADAQRQLADEMRDLGAQIESGLGKQAKAEGRADIAKDRAAVTRIVEQVLAEEVQARAKAAERAAGEKAVVSGDYPPLARLEARLAELDRTLAKLATRAGRASVSQTEWEAKIAPLKQLRDAVAQWRDELREQVKQASQPLLVHREAEPLFNQFLPDRIMESAIGRVAAGISSDVSRTILSGMDLFHIGNTGKTALAAGFWTPMGRAVTMGEALQALRQAAHASLSPAYRERLNEMLAPEAALLREHSGMGMGLEAHDMIVGPEGHRPTILGAVPFLGHWYDVGETAVENATFNGWVRTLKTMLGAFEAHHRMNDGESEHEAYKTAGENQDKLFGGINMNKTGHTRNWLTLMRMLTIANNWFFSRLMLFKDALDPKTGFDSVGKRWAVQAAMLGAASEFMMMTVYSSIANKGEPDWKWVIDQMEGSFTDPVHFLEWKDLDGQWHTGLTFEKDIVRFPAAAYFIVTGQPDKAMDTLGGYLKAREGFIPRLVYDIFANQNFAGNKIHSGLPNPFDIKDDARFLGEVLPTIAYESQPSLLSELEKIDFPVVGSVSERFNEGTNTIWGAAQNITGLGRSRTVTDVQKALQKDYNEKLILSEDGQPIDNPRLTYSEMTTEQKRAFQARHPELKDSFQRYWDDAYKAEYNKLQGTRKENDDMAMSGQRSVTDWKSVNGDIGTGLRAIGEMAFPDGTLPQSDSQRKLLDSFYQTYADATVAGKLDNEKLDDLQGKWIEEHGQAGLDFIKRYQMYGKSEVARYYTAAVDQLTKDGYWQMERYDPRLFASGLAEDTLKDQLAQFQSYAYKQGYDKLPNGQNAPSSMMLLKGLIDVYPNGTGGLSKDGALLYHDLQIVSGPANNANYKAYRDSHKGLTAWFTGDLSFDAVKALMDREGIEVPSGR